MRYWIERKTGIIWGTFRSSSVDHRIIVRAGWGKNRQWVNFEAGIAGWAFFLTRIEQ